MKNLCRLLVESEPIGRGGGGGDRGAALSERAIDWWLDRDGSRRHHPSADDREVTTFCSDVTRHRSQTGSADGACFKSSDVFGLIADSVTLMLMVLMTDVF